MAQGVVAARLAPVPTPKERGQWQMALERFRQHRPAIAGILTLGALAALSIAAPLVSPYDPEKTNLLLIYEPPSLAHPFGTDSLGRDLATRILFGGRVSLSIGTLAVVVAISFGTLAGMLAGYYGRWIDSVLMRFADMMFAFPRLFVLILLGVFFKGMTIGVIVIVLGLLSWMTTARLVRASFLQLRAREFVEAARAIGARDMRIILRHILPNALAPIIVAATLGVAAAIIAESTLSFLGLGIQPPTPAWGNMLGEGRVYMLNSWWIATFPGSAIFVTTLVINLMGNALRDWLDPHMKL